MLLIVKSELLLEKMVKNRTFAFNKKVQRHVLRKSANDARQKSITEDPDEEPVIEDSKRISSLRSLKNTITEKPKEDLSL